MVTCVSIIVEREGSVAVLTVAQRGERGQPGVIFSLSSHHINGRLRGTAALGKMFRPLRLTHHAFVREQ